MGSKPKILSTNNLMLTVILLLFMAQIWILIFHSTRTVRNGDIQHLVANHIYLDMSNIIDFINLSIIERKYSIAKKTLRQFHQGLLLRKVSLALISSSKQ